MCFCWSDENIENGLRNLVRHCSTSWVKSLWSCDTIWHHWSLSTLVEVMAWYHHAWYHQAITLTNTDLSSIKPWGTSVHEFAFGIQIFSFEKMHLIFFLQNISHFLLQYDSWSIWHQYLHMYTAVPSGWVNQISEPTCPRLYNTCQLLTYWWASKNAVKELYSLWC